MEKAWSKIESLLILQPAHSLTSGGRGRLTHWLAARPPEDCGRQAADRVSGVALLATNAHVETKGGHQKLQRMIDVVRSGTGNFKSVAEAFLPLVVHPAHVKDSALVSLLIDMAREVGREGFVLQQITAMNRPDSLGTLRALHVPALVMCGREDQINPMALSEEMASVIEGSELVVVPGHMVTLEQPEATVRATQRWLKRVDTA